MTSKETFMEHQLARPLLSRRVIRSVMGVSGTHQRGLVFVAMSFRGKKSADVFAALKAECKKLRLQAVRVDESVGSGFIIREIVELIEKAEFLIFDLTGERPNVYYELGYAHGVGNKPLDILLLAKKGTKLHFDIAPLRVHFYDSENSLRGIVSRSLKQMIRKTRNPEDGA